MNQSIRGLGFIALVLTLSIVSCKKDSTTDNGNGDENMVSAKNNAMAESHYSDVTTLVDVAAFNGSNMSFRTTEEQSSLLSSCVTVTIDTITSPRSITINFGTNNCLCIDGRNRRGKIMATYTGKYKDSGTVITTTFDNYFVDNNQVKGTHTVTNKGKNVSGNLIYQVEVNGELVKADGGTITWISSRLREWITGANTPLNILDDTYGVTGTANGTNASGNAYAITISQQLVRKMNCRWIESGIVTLVPEGLPAVTLNFGNTGCDANAVVTIANKNYDILLQ